MMTQQESLQRAINEVIEIVPYDSTWSSMYEDERQRLSSLFPGSFLAIEHVGSTSIPGCPAKPIIDILGAVSSLAAAEVLLTSLCANGYSTSSEFNATLNESRWAMRHEEGRRTHHIHLVLLDSEDWKNKIRFRNVLRMDKTLADEYVALKVSLAKAVGSDRERYNDSKSEFVAKVLRSTTKE